MQFAWVIAGFLFGVAVGHFFWKQIKEWASLVLNPILDSINKVVEVWSDAVVYLIKEGTGRVVKRMEVGTQNIFTDEVKTKYVEEKVSNSEIPDEIKDQLQKNAKLKLMQLQQGI